MSAARRRNHRRKLRDVRVEPADFPVDAFRRRVVDVSAVVLLTLMVLALGCKDITVGGFAWSDAPMHAMDGVFLHDLVTQGTGGRDLETWASHFYARYPCLGLVVYYPPLHPVLEAAAYLSFGISEAVARATVVAMAVVAVLALYWLAVQLFDRPSALVAAFLFATAPFGLQWLRDVMLEWPAAAMAILAVGCYRAWYDRPSWRWAILGGAATAAAILTKQTTAFLVALFPLHLVTVGTMAGLRGTWLAEARRKSQKDDLRMAMTVALAAMIILVVLGVYDRISSRWADFNRYLVTGRPPWAHLEQWETYTQYLRWLDEILGWPMLVALLIGLVVIVARWEWRGSRLALTWFVLVWFQQTLIYWKEPRYLFFVLPAAALLVGRGWTLWPRYRRFPLGVVPITGLVVYQFLSGMLTPAGRLPDYADAVQLLADRDDADVVLMDGVRDGQFIFDVRTNPQAAGRIITLRGSKVLYSRTARGREQHRTYLDTPEAILELLNKYGIRYVVVESKLPEIGEARRSAWRESASGVLRRLLADNGRFEEIGRYPLTCRDPRWDGVDLLVYHYREAPARRAKEITIPVKALDRKVTVTLP